MIRLARLSIRRPRAALTFWAIFAVALSLIGLGVSDSLSPSISVVPGSESSRAQTLVRIRVRPVRARADPPRGPATQLDRQGPKLVVALGKRGDTRVMSAWSTGESGRALRPRPDAAMIVASVAKTEEQMVETVQPQIERTVDQRAHGQRPGAHHRPADARPRAQGRGDLHDPPGGADRRRPALRAAADRAAHAGRRVRPRRLRRGHDAHRLRRDGAARPGRSRPTRSQSRSRRSPGLALGVGFSLMIVDRFREEGMAAAGVVARRPGARCCSPARR